MALTRAGGRIGLVLPVRPRHRPWQRAAAAAAAVARCDVDALVGFENHRGVFPDSSQRPLPAADRDRAGSPTRTHRLPARRRRSGGARDRRRRTGGHVAVVPGAADAAAARAAVGRRASRFRDCARRSISRLPSGRRRCFRRSAATPAGRARFGRELNATDDRGAFRAAGGGLPVVEGKQIEPFRVDARAASIGDHGARCRAGCSIRPVRAAAARLPRRGQRHEPAHADRRVLPARCVSTHTVFCLRTPLPLAISIFSAACSTASS